MNPGGRVITVPLLHNDAVSPLFQAVIEATEEAVDNSLFKATTTAGYGGHTVDGLPVARVLEICRKHNLLRETR